MHINQSPLTNIGAIKMPLIVECPRDAMQGWPTLIPTIDKIRYLNALLTCGFHTLDFGSFVSPKAIPQMADTLAVVDELDVANSPTKLLAIVANERGADEAILHEKITYLGFPFSISPTFQQRNTNASIEQALDRVAAIQNSCVKANKQLVVYLSMGFGNPYGDVYDVDMLIERMKQIESLGINIISIADTVGLATASQVNTVMKNVLREAAQVQIGVHLHATHTDIVPKLEAAYSAGCHRYDAAIKGIGGCPLAGNTLVGNTDTELMLQYFETKGLHLAINEQALQNCVAIANEIFV